MHCTCLENDEQHQIEGLVNEIFSGSPHLEMHSFLKDAAVFAHQLPRRLRKLFNNFRLSESSTGLCVKGNPIWEEELPKTPLALRRGGQVELVERPVALHLLYACLLGEPFSWTTIQNGYIINDILPIEGNSDRPVSSGSSQLFDLHTEDAFSRYAGDYLGLMCLRNPDRVPTILAAIDDIELPERIKQILLEPRFVVSPNIAHGVKRTATRSPILFGHPEHPYLRINMNVEQHLDDDPAAQEALNFLMGQLRERSWDLVLEPGDCCYIDNFRVVHGRAPYSPKYDGGDRWLKRLYITSSFRQSRAVRLMPQSRIIRPDNAVRNRVTEIIDLSFTVGEEVLSAHVITDDLGTRPRLLFLHGAGRSNKERARPLALELAGQGVSSFGFDFSGHGESSGELGRSSLAKRVQEAEGALGYLARDRPISLCASSMGAHIALELTLRVAVENLFLFAPAIYSREAVDLPFDERFSSVIRQEGSWRDAAVLDALDEFTGNLFIFIGEDDEVIPRKIVETILRRAGKARRAEIQVFPRATHLLLDRLYMEPALLEEVVTKIVAACTQAPWAATEVPPGPVPVSSVAGPAPG